MTAITNIVVGTDWTAVPTAGGLAPWLFNAADEAIEIGIPDPSVNIMPDGDAEAPTTAAYTSRNAAALSKEPGARTGGAGLLTLMVAFGGTAGPYARELVHIVGQTNRLMGWACGDGFFAPDIRDGGVILWAGTASADWQYFDVVYTATTVYIRLVSTATATGYAKFDDMTIYPVPTLSIPSGGPPRQVLPGMTVYARCASGAKVLQVLRGCKPIIPLATRRA